MTTSTETVDVRHAIERTAYYPAIMRAIESVSPNRIIYDPFSLALIPAELFDELYAKYVSAEHQKTYLDFHALRARAVYEVIMTPNVLPQTVLLGAGLDTIAWRESHLKDVYEIDKSEMFINKIQRLPKTINQGKHIMIHADLATDQWEQMLLDHGFDPKLPTVWIMEGLLFYCTPETTTKMFQNIDRLSAKQSRIFFDHWPSNYGEANLRAKVTFQSYVDNPLEAFQWFIKTGWSMKKMIDFGETGEHYGRSHQTFYLRGIPLNYYFVFASKME